MMIVKRTSWFPPLPPSLPSLLPWAEFRLGILVVTFCSLNSLKEGCRGEVSADERGTHWLFLRVRHVAPANFEVTLLVLVHSPRSRAQCSAVVKMPATAGRVKMPADNRVHIGSSLSTSSIWVKMLCFLLFGSPHTWWSHFGFFALFLLQRSLGDDVLGAGPDAGIMQMPGERARDKQSWDYCTVHVSVH